MKAKGMFLSTVLIIDTFLVSYAAGFNSRHVLVIDPALPPLQVKIDNATDKTKSADHKSASANGDESVSGNEPGKAKAADAAHKRAGSKEKHHTAKSTETAAKESVAPKHHSHTTHSDKPPA